MYLYPKTIRKGNFLGNIDIVVRKPKVEEKPTESHILFIENGEAFYATSVSPQNSNGRFKTEFSIGDADLVAIEFDAEWHKDLMDKYRPITLSEPWLFRINGQKLLAQKGETFNPLELDTGNITALKAVRAWHNIIIPEDDQGLVVLYIKDGIPHYVNYSFQPQGYKEWSNPIVIPGFTAATHISGFRTNDYRLILLIEEAGVTHQVVSVRNWAGIGIPGEQVGAGVDSFKVTMTELTYHEATGKTDRVAVSTTTDVNFGTITTVNRFTSVSNVDAFTIIVTLDEEIFNPDVVSFRMKDSRNRAFRIG
jgi:hypothetical protein